MSSHALVAAVVVAVVVLAGCAADTTNGSDQVMLSTSPTTETTMTTTTAPTEESTTTAAVAATISCSDASYTTGGVTIVAERCAPGETAAPVPAVVVLPGCAGYESDAEITSDIARALAARGVIGLRIDYLGARPAAPGTYCNPASVLGATQPLLQAIADGVALLRDDPDVDPSRIGGAGYSLGALALSAAHLGGAGLAAVPPLQLSAISLLSFPNFLPQIIDAAGAGQFAPLLCITGELDATAPPAGAQALVEAALAGGTPAGLTIVPGQEHPWRGASSDAGAQQVADFLAARLLAG